MARKNYPKIHSEYIPYSRVIYEKYGCFYAAIYYNHKLITYSIDAKEYVFSMIFDEKSGALSAIGSNVAKSVQKNLIQKLKEEYPQITLEQQHACFPDSIYNVEEECYYKDRKPIPIRISPEFIPVYGISYACEIKTPSRCYFLAQNQKKRLKKCLNLSVCREIWDEGNKRLTALGLELAENLQRDLLKTYNNTIQSKKADYCSVRNVFYKIGKKPPVPAGYQLPQTLDCASNTDITGDSSEPLPSPNLPSPQPLAAESCDSSATNELSEESSDDAQSSTNDTLARSNTLPPTTTVKQEPDLRLPIAHQYHEPELTFRNKAKTTMCHWITGFNKRKKAEHTVFEYDSKTQKYLPIKHQQSAQMYQKYLEEWFSSSPLQRAEKEQELVTVKQISEDDPRVGLRNQNGLFASTKDIKENCILGVYSGTYMLYGENIEDRTDIRAELVFLQENYACGSDAYGNYTISIILNNQSILTVSGLHRGSACSFINAPAKNDKAGEGNAVFKIVTLKGQPPVVLAVTTKPIPASAEIITHYGNHYWDDCEYGRNKAQPIYIPLDVLSQLPETEQLNDDDRKLYTENDIKQAAETTKCNKTVKYKVGKKREHSDDNAKKSKRTRYSKPESSKEKAHSLFTERNFGGTPSTN